MEHYEMLRQCETCIAACAKRLLRKYGCSPDTLPDLEQEGRLAVLLLIERNSYVPEQGSFPTYAAPFILGAMHRYLEQNLGNLAVSREEMQQIIKAKRLWADGRTAEDICEQLGIERLVLDGYIGYDLHFFSAHDMSEEEDFDPYEQEAFADKLQESPEKITFRNGCTERLQLLFDQLSGKERSILGHTFGVFGYEMLTASEIAVLELMTENGVNKAKRAAIEKLIKLYPDSELQVWRNIWDGLECVRRKWEEK